MGNSADSKLDGLMSPDGGRSADDSELARRIDELAALYRLTDRLYRANSLAETCDAAMEAILSTLGCDRASILLFDENGAMRFVAWRGLSDTYRKAVDGHSPWTPHDRDPEPIFVADIEETEEPEPLKEAIRNERIRALAFIPLVADGQVVGKFMTYHAQRHDFPQGERDLAVNIARQLGFSLERTKAEEAREDAEAALRESEERFRLMSENAPVMIWMSKPDGSCLHLNRMQRQTWNVSEDDIESFDWRTMMHPDDAPEIVRRITEALTSRSPAKIEGRYRSSGGGYSFLLTDARPRFSSRGEFLGMIGVNVDISERKEAEAQREMLMAELNHRIKNTLAVVQGLAHQTFRGSAETQEALQAFDGRLSSLAKAHSLLTETNWERASLKELAASALPALEAGRIVASGPDILLESRQTLAFALAFHELCTNAVKYGALSNDQGRIMLEWSISDGVGPRLRVVWREEAGRPVSPPSQSGFGTRLIEQMLARDIGATVAMDFRPQGLVCTIDAPAPEPADQGR